LTDQVIILTEAGQADLVREELPELDADGVIVEPSPRGTTSALGLAALELLARDPDAVMLSMAADHVIGDLPEWERAGRLALGTAAGSDHLVTVGLRPRHPATGYGYIRASGPYQGHSDVLVVDGFVEKPDLEQATEYLRDGNYFWNLNTFSWRASVFLDELRRWSPEHFDGLTAVVRAARAGDSAAAARLYGSLSNQAVDYTVLERTDRLLLVPAQFGWDDVGSWPELHEILASDAEGNFVQGEAVLVESKGSLVLGEGLLVAGIGLEDMIVVVSGSAVLICPKSRAQDVKLLTEQLRRTGKINYL
jgi:mannose-1-phosphate guanylyltransferase/mannose-6-phosphate isomerase